ncbi:hypothetical protein KAU33_03250, partial [Candidatus Dependentiae bacterium]|nr:hypothetical protein [Candidatus Dependentiae bacterium]
EKTIVNRVSYPINLDTENSTMVTYNIKYSPNINNIGIWWISYSLFDSQGNKILYEYEAKRVAVTRRPKPYEGNKITASVVCERETVVKGETIPFTIYVWNNDEIPRTVRIYYDWTHEEKVFYKEIDIQPESNIIETINFQVPKDWRSGQGRFWVHLYDPTEPDSGYIPAYAIVPGEDSKYLTSASKGVTIFDSPFNIDISTDKDTYQGEDEIKVNVSIFKNLSSDIENVEVEYNFYDTENVLIHSEKQTISFSFYEVKTISFTSILKRYPLAGLYQCEIIIRSNGFESAEKKTVSVNRLNIVNDIRLANEYKIDNDNITGLIITNNSDTLLKYADADISVKDPYGTEIYNTVFNFENIQALSEQTKEFNLPLSTIALGNYEVTGILKTSCGEYPISKTLPSSLDITVSADKEEYKAGENINAEVSIENTGKTKLEFPYTFQTSISLDNDSGNIIIVPGQTLEISKTFLISDSVIDGEYNIMFNYEISGMHSSGITILIPESELEIEFDNDTITAGSLEYININNLGGEHTSFDLTISLKEEFGSEVLFRTYSNNVIKAGATVQKFLIPDSQTISGLYILEINCTDRETQKVSKLRKLITVTGISGNLAANLDKQVYSTTDIISPEINLENNSTLNISGSKVTYSIYKEVDINTKTISTSEDFNTGEFTDTYSNNDKIQLKFNYELDRRHGGYLVESRKFRGISLDNSGNLYVNFRNYIFKLDSDLNYQKEWYDSTVYPFNSGLYDSSIDSSGNLYVVDKEVNKTPLIRVFDSNLNQLSTINLCNYGPVTDIEIFNAFMGEYIYVPNTMYIYNSIDIYNLSGIRFNSIFLPFIPLYITITLEAGRVYLYITEENTNKIHKYSFSGGLIETFTVGSEKLKGIVQNSSNSIFCLANNGRDIFKLNTDGSIADTVTITVQGTWGDEYIGDNITLNNGKIYIWGLNEYSVLVYDTGLGLMNQIDIWKHIKQPQFNQYNYIDINDNDEIVVSDYDNLNAISKFNSDFSSFDYYGQRGVLPDGNTFKPKSVSISNSGDIYSYIKGTNHPVLVLDSNLEYSSTFETFQTGGNTHDIYFDDLNSKLYFGVWGEGIWVQDVVNNTHEIWPDYNSPFGITGDNEGNLIITDLRSGSEGYGIYVIKVDGTGNIIETLKFYDVLDNIDVTDIAYDKNLDILYVLKWIDESPSIDVISGDGILITTITEIGINLSKWPYYFVNQIDVNSSGELFISNSDGRTSQLEVFDKSYLNTGTFSYVFDSVDTYYFETIFIDSTTPAGTNVKFRFRVSNNKDNLENVNWSTWKNSGDELFPEFSRFIEVEILLETTNSEFTPELNSIEIIYKAIDSPIWTQQQDLALQSGQVYNNTLATTALTSIGKYIFVASWENDFGQVLDEDKKKFLVNDSEFYLVFNTDKENYLTNDPIIINGYIANISGIVETNLEFKLKKDGIEIYSELIPSLSPGATYPFTVTLTGDKSFLLTGIVKDFEYEKLVVIDSPALEMIATAPEVVGREEFYIEVQLTNPTKSNIDGALNIGEFIHPFELSPGEGRLFYNKFNIFEDTDFIISSTGDVEQQIIKAVRFGEDAEILISGDSIYPDTTQGFQIDITNTGEVPEEITVFYTILSNGLEVEKHNKTYALEPGEIKSDNLEYSLPIGDYTIEAYCLYNLKTKQFSVIPDKKISTDLIVGCESGNSVPVSVVITNSGYSDFNGYVSVFTDFWSGYEGISIPSNKSLTWDVYIPTTGIPAGLYHGNSVIVDMDLVPVKVKEFEYKVIGPVFEIISMPNYPVFDVNTLNTVSFTVANTGAQTGECNFEFKILENDDNKKSFSLEPGAQQNIECLFGIPYDIRTGDYFAEYSLNGKKGTMKFHVKGIEIMVNSSVDKQLYEVGENVNLTLDISNLNPSLQPELTAQVIYAAETMVQEFKLVNNHTLQFSFLAKANFSKITFGLLLETGRYVYLSFKNINIKTDDIAFYTDKQLYNPGEPVLCTVEAYNTGAFTVESPFGYENTIEVTEPNTFTFSFNIPNEVTQGTYKIDYSFRGRDYKYAIDVKGYWIRILGFSTDKPYYFNGEDIECQTRISSNSTLDAVFKCYLGDEVEENKIFEKDVSLVSGEDIYLSGVGKFDSIKLGSVPLNYTLSKKDNNLFLSGGTCFITGVDFNIINASTDKEFYFNENDDVTLNVDFESNIDFYMTVFLNEQVVDKVSIDPAAQENYSTIFNNSIRGWNAVKIVLEKGTFKKTYLLKYYCGLLAPENVNIEENCDSALVTWDKSIDPNVTGYRVYISDTPNTFVNFEDINVEEYLVSNLVKNTPVCIKLKSFDKDGNLSEFTDVYKIIWDYVCPPQNLTAEVSNRNVALEWEKGTEPEVSSYKVYRNGSMIEEVTDGGVSGGELRNLSLDTGATVSTNRPNLYQQYPQQYSIENTIDGNLGSLWRGSSPLMQVSNGYIQLNFTEMRDVYEVKIYWSLMIWGSINFNIEVWENNTWVIKRTVLNHLTSYSHIILDESVRTDKVRVNITNVSTGYFFHCGVREFEIYGTDIKIAYLDENLPDGEYKYHVTSIDPIGSESEPSNEVVVWIGSEYNPPIVNITNPVESKWYKDDLNITAIVTDDNYGVQKVEYLINSILTPSENDTPTLMTLTSGNTLAGEYSALIDTNLLSDGEYTLSVSAYDYILNGPDSVVGDLNPDEVIFKIDNTKPEANITIGTPQIEVNGALYINDDTELILTGSDNLSGIDWIKYKPDNTWLDYTIPIKLDGEDGSYTLSYYCKDIAGNESEIKTYDVKFDNTSPSSFIWIGDPQQTIEGNIYVEFETPFVLYAWDSGCGISNIQYRINSGDWQIYDG